MTTIPPDCAVTAAAWPADVARRGACVAIAIVIFLLIRPPTFLLLGDFSADMAWFVDAWVLWPALAACLALPFLGPRAVQEIIGPQLRAGSALAGLTCGVVGAVLSVVFTMLASRAGSPPGAISGPLFFHWSLTTILVGPLVEEWLCRGILWHAVRRLFRPFMAILITATVFTLAHGLDRASEFPYLLIGGLMFGWLRHWSGSLSPSLLAHSVTNLGLTLVVPVLLTR